MVTFNPSDIDLVMNQVNLPANMTQTHAYVVNVQGMDIVISLLTIMTILLMFILRYLIKRSSK